MRLHADHNGIKFTLFEPHVYSIAGTKKNENITGYGQHYHLLCPATFLDHFCQATIIDLLEYK